MNLAEIFEEYNVQIIATAITILVIMLAKYITRKIIRRYGRLYNKSEPRMIQVRHIMAVIFNVTFILSIAVIWGLRTENLLVGLTTIVTFLGVALFAQWSVLSNITAGIIIYFSAPYRLGDRIRIIDKDIPITAVIESIKTFYTHIRTEEGELIVLPNNIFLQKVIAVITEREE